MTWALTSLLCFAFFCNSIPERVCVCFPFRIHSDVIFTSKIGSECGRRPLSYQIIRAVANMLMACRVCFVRWPFQLSHGACNWLILYLWANDNNIPSQTKLALALMPGRICLHISMHILRMNQRVEQFAQNSFVHSNWLHKVFKVLSAASLAFVIFSNFAYLQWLQAYATRFTNTRVARIHSHRAEFEEQKSSLSLCLDKRHAESELQLLHTNGMCGCAREKRITTFQLHFEYVD